MAKTDVTKRRTRQSKVVEEEDIANTEEQTEAVSNENIVRIEEDSPTESARVELKPDDDGQDEQDPQMDAVIEVKGNTPTVTVSWETKNEEGEGDNTMKTTDATEQMTVEETMTPDEQTQIISSTDAPSSSQEECGQTAETKMEQEVEESEDKEESQMDVVVENKTTVTVTWKDENEEGNGVDAEKETNENEQMTGEESVVNGKRKAEPTSETSPSKKTKLINDGFCVFISNLNSSKTSEEVKDSLANYFMTQSLLFQDIRLHRSRKHAFVDLASEMDLTKALTLDGEMILDKPLKIAKAKVKSADKVKKPLDKKDKDARCLFLKNVPYNVTKQDILKVFRKAVAVRFLGGAESPTQGIAFVEFKNTVTAKSLLRRKKRVKIQGRVLIVDSVGESEAPKVPKADADKKSTKAAAPPSNALFVNNLSYSVKEKNLKAVFQKAVSIVIPQTNGKPRGYAFVEFATVADAEKAKLSSQNVQICKRDTRVEFCEFRSRPEKQKVLSKTLIVSGLAEKTTAETLKGAFEGALDARVIVNKETGVSKRFGFVEFESEENCKTAKEAMEDCEIDGSKVTLGYAKPKIERGPQGAGGGPVGRPGRQAVAPGAGRGERGNKGGSLRGGKSSTKGKGRGAGKTQNAVKELKCKN